MWQTLLATFTVMNSGVFRLGRSADLSATKRRLNLGVPGLPPQSERSIKDEPVPIERKTRTIPSCLYRTVRT